MKNNKDQFEYNDGVGDMLRDKKNNEDNTVVIRTILLLVIILLIMVMFFFLSFKILKEVRFEAQRHKGTKALGTSGAQVRGKGQEKKSLGVQGHSPARVERTKTLKKEYSSPKCGSSAPRGLRRLAPLEKNISSPGVKGAKPLKKPKSVRATLAVVPVKTQQSQKFKKFIYSYKIVSGVYVNYDLARIRVNELKGKGIDAFIFPLNKKYYVQIGALPNYSKANIVSREFNKKGLETIIINVPK